MENGRGFNKVLVFGIVGFVIFLAGVFIWIFISNNRNKKIVPSDFLDIAEVNLDWINRQKDKNGIYPDSVVCQNKNFKECESKFLPNTNGDGLVVIWGKFKYYQMTKDSKYLRSLKEDIKNYSDKKKINAIENAFFNCSLMYDLWKSDILNNEEKKNVENFCFNSFYQEVGFSPNDPLLQDRVLEEVSSLNNFDLKNRTLIDGFLKRFNAFENKEFANQYLIAPDYLKRFLWRGNNEDLRVAYRKFELNLFLFLRAYGIINPPKMVVFDGYSYKEVNSANYRAFTLGCSNGLVLVDLYKMTKNENYKNLAIKFFDLLFADNNVDNLSEGDGAVCSFFINKLYEIDKKDIYLGILKEMSNFLVNRAFDYYGYSTIRNGDGGFFTRNSDVFIKKIRYNGLLIGLLSELKNGK